MIQGWRLSNKYNWTSQYLCPRSGTSTFFQIPKLWYWGSGWYMMLQTCYNFKRGNITGLNRSPHISFFSWQDGMKSHLNTFKKWIHSSLLCNFIWLSTFGKIKQVTTNSRKILNNHFWHYVLLNIKKIEIVCIYLLYICLWFVDQFMLLDLWSIYFWSQKIKLEGREWHVAVVIVM